MKRAFVLAAAAALLSGTLTAATNSQTIYLAAPVRAGNGELPRGICEVSWDSASGLRVRLSLKAEDGKTFAVFAHRVDPKPGATGAVTSVVRGVTYLREIHTREGGFILDNRAGGSH